MRMKRAAISLLLFTAILSSVTVLTSTGFADTKHITVKEPVTIGNIVLQPGDYKVVWQGSGPDVQVSFINKNTTATTSAKVVVEKRRGRSFETVTMPDNSKVVKRISFRSKSLVFDQSSLAGESQNDDLLKP